MTITLIDEARYDAEMDATVLPALQACMTEGWMEPATVDWEGKALPKLERPGRLHYYRYDARTFDALREEGASGVFRGTIVISHGFTNSDANTAKWCGTFCWPAIRCACSSIAGMAIPRTI